jgi:cation diffusion facilitator CzcD-associated flavoprotein CzcO
VSLRQSLAPTALLLLALTNNRYLRAEKKFNKITLFEQRVRPGGIWNYTPQQQTEDLFTVPQTNPHGKNQEPAWIEKCSSPRSAGNVNADNGANKAPSFLSPMYETLETNIPRGLMGFSDLDWPSDSQLFPTHETVLQYIEDYSADVQDIVRYSTQVTDISATDDRIDGTWQVTTRDLHNNESTTAEFDAVIVANGHFITPYIPPIPGLSEWSTAHPSAVSHSKYYRRATDFQGKKVVVIGNSASGSDISMQISAVSLSPLLWSSKSANLFSSAASSTPARRSVPQIAAFLPESRGVRFVDGSEEHEIDSVVFATGYFYSLPFLSNLSPALISDGSHVQHTYQHIFYHPRPTLAFLALPQRVIPFPVAEAQAAAVARVFSGRLSLPSQSEMCAAEKAVLDTTANPRDFHLLPFPRDGEYINALAAWCRSATVVEGLENGGKGKCPPEWGPWAFWCRENFPAIRRAFVELGEKRKTVRKLEEVGFVWEGNSEVETSDENNEVDQVDRLVEVPA